MSLPKARENGLLFEEIDGEFVVFDHERQEMHRLNASASYVWRRCDGRTTTEEIARGLERELGGADDGDLVALALEFLREAHLLEGDEMDAPTNVSRRATIKRVGAAAAAAAILPVVESLVVPTPAMAQSNGVTGATGATGATGQQGPTGPTG